MVGTIFFILRDPYSRFRYTEAVALFKSPQDVIWHGSVLVGMATCHIIEAWSVGHGLVRLFVKGMMILMLSKILTANLR